MRALTGGLTASSSCNGVRMRSSEWREVLGTGRGAVLVGSCGMCGGWSGVRNRRSIHMAVGVQLARQGHMSPSGTCSNSDAKLPMLPPFSWVHSGCRQKCPQAPSERPPLTFLHNRTGLRSWPTGAQTMSQGALTFACGCFSFLFGRNSLLQLSVCATAGLGQAAEVITDVATPNPSCSISLP